MNALVRKEVRLLLPSSVVGALLIAAPAVLTLADAGRGLVVSLSMVSLATPVLAALSSFGREFDAGTFSSVLALPIPRSRIWWTKVRVLGVALLCLFCAWWISFLICQNQWLNPAPPEWLTPWMVGALLLAAFSGDFGQLWCSGRWPRRCGSRS
jgi:ABC-type transport system involved in multi-copper enzyme maturation permease subunit